MALNLMGLATDAARLRRIAALLQDGMGEGAAPLPAAIDLLNRALRPLAVLAVIGGIAAAFADPARYAAAMAALQVTPLPVWAMAGGIVALHYVTRAGAAAGGAKLPRT